MPAIPTPTTHPAAPARTRTLLAAAAVFALVAAQFAGCKADVRERDVTTIPIVEARRVSSPGSGAILMDARPASAFAQGHIPGAINVRVDSVDAAGPKNPAWTRAPAIIVYAEDSGSAAARALARRLMQAGYENVRVMEGGIAEWKEMGLEVSR